MSDLSTQSDSRPWHVRTGEEVLSELGVELGQGLSSGEAAARRARHGRNEIQESRRRTPLGMFAAQFADFMIVVLLAAAAVGALAGEARDAIAILAIVGLNAVIGAVQEYRAERAIAALRQMAAPEVRLLRDGKWTTRPASEVVPGDVVRLEAGNVVTADLRLLEALDLRVDEAPLTGESQPVQKAAEALSTPDLPLGDRVNLAYGGTLVTGGRGTGVAIATGMSSELGRIAGLLRGAESVRTPLQLRLARFGKNLALAVLGICGVIFAAGIVRGEPPLLMFLTAVSLAVAAIPEALPAVVTVSLALGARKMILRKALVRRLPAVETLGSVTFVCADKTGTLTQNKMRVDALYADGRRVDQLPRSPGAGRPWELLARALALNNDAQREAGAARGDPTEVALLAAAEAAGYDQAALEREAPRIGEIAFSSERRRMTTLHRDADGVIAFVKGAPRTVVERCRDALHAGGGCELDPLRVLQEAERMASDGYRVLALAYRRFRAAPDPTNALDVESELTFLGLAALMDPPRDEAAAAVSLCQSAGITPVMITGDHPQTARAIARRLGIVGDEDGVVTGRELARLAPAELERRVRSTRIYARVSPEQKIAIVRALQDCGEFVAMTGDGVNDAPALKRAEIGVAMGLKGTDVAREAADMVLMDDNFATIVAAVREGRRIFDNIRKFVKYTMTSNSGEIWVLFLAPFLGLPIPLLPIQILWINLVTDGLPGLAFAAEPEERGLMRRAPRPPSESIFAHGMGQHVVWVGLLIAGLSIGAQAWAYHSGSANWQSVVFTVLTLSQLANALAIRSDRDSLFAIGLHTNLPLLGAVALTLGLQLMVLYVPALNRVFNTAPLAARELAVCFALPLVVLATIEAQKWLASSSEAEPGTGPTGPRRSR